MSPATPESPSGDIANSSPASPLPTLALRPRDAHFAVMVEGRLPRAGHLPFQVAIPQELHHRLRLETLGSLNQVLVALMRQALAWLDADQFTLHAEAHPGPIPAAAQTARPTSGLRTEAQRRENFLIVDRRWPNAVLDTRPRNDHWAIVQPERQPRVDAQLMQIALPVEVHQRLVRDGLGAVSQLVISLARYSLRRLDQENLTLDVRPAMPPADALSMEPEEQIVTSKAVLTGTGESMTVGQLIRALSSVPPDTPVMYEIADEHWGGIRKAAWQYIASARPDGEPPSTNNPKGDAARLVLLTGRSFDVAHEFDGGVFEPDEQELILKPAKYTP